MNYKRRRSHYWGIMAEYLCAGWLVIKGYSILHLRYRNYAGEVDIVARKAKTIICIEVKARKDGQGALYSVSPSKQKIIARAAESFLAQHPAYLHLGLRFDVMVVTSFLKINHVKNAWRM